MVVSVVTPSIRPSGLIDVQRSLEKQSYKNFEWLVEIGLPARGNDLNKAYNRMIRRAKGDIIISIQDYTTCKRTFISNIVNTYEQDTFYTATVGHSDGVITEWDWRKKRKGQSIKFYEFEICAAVMPTAALFEIGGFDEGLDELTWGFDNVNLGLRIDMAGYPMKVHPDAEAVQFRHDLTEKHPWREEMNSVLHNDRLDRIRNRSVVIDYLK